MQDLLMDVRTSLTTTTNVTGGLGSATWGAVEIQKKVDQLIHETINRGVDLKPLLNRMPVDQLTKFFNIRSDLGSTSKFSVYSDGGTGTPYPSTKYQFYATCISYRADYEVTGLMQAGAISYYDAIADEAADALSQMSISEEKMMICGDTTGAYGITSAFNGLLQLMRWYDTNGGDTDATGANQMKDTTTVYGLARDGSAQGDVLDVSYVLAGTPGTATGVLELKHLDEAKTRSNKHGGKGRDRIFFCSEERGDEIDRLLQPQQRFQGTLNLEGGFTLSTYKTIPIVRSRFMDKNGATNTTSWDKDTDADNSMYMLDLSEIQMDILAGVDTQHVAVMGETSGSAGYNRADVSGGYFKTYGVLVMSRFNTQVHIANLTAPA